MEGDSLAAATFAEERQSIGLFDGIEPPAVQDILDKWFPDEWEGRLGRLATQHTLYYIEHGAVEITLPVGHGNPNVPVLIRLSKGDFFGENRLLFSEPLTHARVVPGGSAAGRALHVERGDPGFAALERLLDSHPRIGVNLVAELARRLLAASRFVPSHAAPLRIGYFLLGATTKSPLVQVDGVPALASQLGLSPPAVSHALAILQRTGVIELGREPSLCIRVTDPDGLCRYLGVTPAQQR